MQGEKHIFVPVLFQAKLYGVPKSGISNVQAQNSTTVETITHPIRIIDDDGVSRCEVYSQPPSPRAQQEHMAVRVLTKHDHLKQDERYTVKTWTGYIYKYNVISILVVS